MEASVGPIQTVLGAEGAFLPEMGQGANPGCCSSQRRLNSRRCEWPLGLKSVPLLPSTFRQGTP